MDLHYCSSALVHNLFHSLGEAIKKKKRERARLFFYFNLYLNPESLVHGGRK